MANCIDWSKWNNPPLWAKLGYESQEDYDENYARSIASYCTSTWQDRAATQARVREINSKGEVNV